MKPQRHRRHTHPMFKPISLDTGFKSGYNEPENKVRPNVVVRVAATMIVVGLFAAAVLFVTGVIWWLLQFFFI